MFVTIFGFSKSQFKKYTTCIQVKL